MLPVLLMALAAVGILAFSMDRGETKPLPPDKVPAPTPKPLPAPTSNAALLQRKHVIVKRAVELAANMRRHMLGQIGKTESPQASLAVVKSHFVKAGVDVGMPSVTKPFWRQTEAAIALKATAAVNSMPKPVAPGAPVPKTPTPVAVKK